MPTYQFHHPELGDISYQDKKRYLWLSSFLLPLVPLAGIALYWSTGSEWWFLLPFIFLYFGSPALDWLIGTDSDNPPEEVVPQLETDRFYRYLTYATVPTHFLVLVSVAAFVGTADISFGSILILAVITGIYSGLGINTGHELGHKKTNLERWLAKIVLAVPAYGHFWIEHNRGHHRDVATPEDPASARMGESIYKFALREIPGGFKRAWNHEKDRMQRLGKSTFSFQNEILQSYWISLFLQLALIISFGPIMILFLVIHNAWAWFQLTSANYIEHYGLLRKKEPSGRYERCLPHHSWNANHLFSNIVLFHLERHSDHHANPTRRYQSLRDYSDVPALPNGYFGMYLVAYIPYLWFKVMDKRLLALEHINGDLNNVNLDPDKRDQLFQRYGQVDQSEQVFANA